MSSVLLVLVSVRGLATLSSIVFIIFFSTLKEHERGLQDIMRQFSKYFNKRGKSCKDTRTHKKDNENDDIYFFSLSFPCSSSDVLRLPEPPTCR